MKRILLPLIILLAMCAGVVMYVLKSNVSTLEECCLVVNTPEEALAALKAGNERYVSGTPIHPRCDMERVQATAPHQAPFAAVVGCSDSRVPVELVFDQGVGDIFVIRTAGNNVNNDVVMGSIDYAVEHLGVKVLLVMGHGSCGGVTSAISNGEEQGAIGNLLESISNDIPECMHKIEDLDNAIRYHAHVQVERILSSPHIMEKIEKGELLIKRAYYDVHSGRVTIDG